MLEPDAADWWRRPQSEEPLAGRHHDGHLHGEQVKTAIIVRSGNVGSEPGTFVPVVWFATNEPPPFFYILSFTYLTNKYRLVFFSLTVKCESQNHSCKLLSVKVHKGIGTRYPFL